MPLDIINRGDDMMFHYRRISSLMLALRDGNFPVYLDFDAFENYGYGAKWFYGDLLLIPFAYLANLTDFIFAYKSMWFIMTILCGLFTYKLINRIYNNTTAATLGALLFAFSSYRFQDIFQRGALGEAMSFTFIPIVFYGLYEIIKGDYRKWYIIAIGFSLLIYTHLLSTLLTFVTILIFIVIYNKDFVKHPKRFFYLILAGIVTILMSSSFLLPFIEQINSTNFHIDLVKLDTHSRLDFYTFLKSVFNPHLTNFRLVFLPHIGGLLVAFLFLRFFIKEKSPNIKSVDIGVCIGLVYLILPLKIIPWDIYPLKLLSIIQFPWRFFEFSTLFFAIAGGYYLSYFIKREKYSSIQFSTVVLTIGFLIITSGYIYKEVKGYYNPKIEITKMTLDNYRDYFGNAEYFPLKLESIEILKNRGNNIIVTNNGTISNIERDNGLINFSININNIKSKAELPLIYYKGYTARIKDKEVEVHESSIGLVEISVNESGNVTVQFSGTFLQKYSIYISLLSFLLLLVYIYIYNRNSKNNV